MCFIWRASFLGGGVYFSWRRGTFKQEYSSLFLEEGPNSAGGGGAHKQEQVLRSLGGGVHLNRRIVVFRRRGLPQLEEGVHMNWSKIVV